MAQDDGKRAEQAGKIQNDEKKSGDGIRLGMTRKSRLIVVYQFGCGNRENFAKLPQGFDIRLRSPLLPVGIATFHNV